MKKLLLLLLAVLSVTACSKEEGNDIKELCAQLQVYYIYDAQWIIDRQAVDGTQFYVDLSKGVNIMVDRYPSQHLFAWVNDNRSFANGVATVGAMAGTVMNMFNNGYSDTSDYFNNTSDTSVHKVIINGQAYDVTLHYEPGTPTAVYDSRNDQWTATWKVTAVTLTSVYHPEAVITHTYQPSFTMLLLTTKRVK